MQGHHEHHHHHHAMELRALRESWSNMLLLLLHALSYMAGGTLAVSQGRFLGIIIGRDPSLSKCNQLRVDICPLKK